MMQVKFKEISLLYRFAFTGYLFTFSPAALNASLGPQRTRGLNKPGVFRDQAFRLMQEAGFAWDAWCHSCH